MPVEMASQKLDQSAVGIKLARAVFFEDRLSFMRTHGHERIGGEKRIPREPFAAFDGFEQESLFGVMRDAHKRADRRMQIGEHAAHDRHDIALARFRLKFFECPG